MKFKNVLLASDFDGTLKNDSGVITPDVIEAIKYFIKEGGFFTVCTGRVFQGFHLYREEYINAPVLLGNGAMAYDYKENKAIFDDAIEEEGIKPLEEIHRLFPEAAFEMYSFKKVTALNPEETSVRHFTSQDISFETVKSFKEAVLPWTKVMIHSLVNSKAIQKELEKYPEINFLRTDGDYIEVLKKGVDKGVGLLKLGKALGCKKADIYSAGDGYNDVEMLKAAHAGFVPENGSEEALLSATYITRSNNDGCIAHAIEILDGLYK